MKTELEKREILRFSNEESNKITLECLRIAMIKLMGKKEFEEISITEIAKLAEDICKSLVSELKTSVSGEKFRTDRKNWYIIFFKTIKENSEYFQIYLNAHLQFGDVFVLDSVYPPNTTAEHYLNSAKQGAFMKILTDWFQDGMRESPEEMGLLCEQLIYNTIDKKQREESGNGNES